MYYTHGVILLKLFMFRNTDTSHFYFMLSRKFGFNLTLKISFMFYK